MRDQAWDFEDATAAVHGAGTGHDARTHWQVRRTSSAGVLSAADLASASGATPASARR
jgi:hypothetical protein